MSKFDWRSADTYSDLQDSDAAAFAWEYLRRNPEYRRDYEALADSITHKTSDAPMMRRRWASAFAPDPERSSSQQTIFWAPEILPTVLHLEPATGEFSTPTLDAIDFADADIRRAEDGSHVLLRISGTTHRLWLSEERQAVVPYEVRLPLDDFFDHRALAALRLWRALAGRRASEDPNGLTHQRRQRLTQALRALDARDDGATYRAIAEALFGAKRIPERAWKTHDLRGRTIRLVASGYELMRGRYRKLLATFRRER